MGINTKRGCIMDHYAVFNSPMGQLLLVSDGAVLTGVYMNREIPEKLEDLPVFSQAKNWLEDYFRGIDRKPDVPMEPSGTVFQKQVWKILQTIPWGQTRTYGSIAAEMASIQGKEKMSAQAIGQAVGKNPLSILIPCHRVMGAGGKLTGYAGGIANKQWLLNHENKKDKE